MRTAAAPNPRATWLACGDFTNVKVANGRETIGPENGLRLKKVV
jgi:hypothetical protein